MGESAELRNYRLTYERSMQPLFKKAKSMKESKLLSALAQKKLSLFGDHHAYPQSQRTLIHFLNEMDKNLRPRYCLVLEAFLPEHDIHLEKYLKGRISLLELRQRTRFDQQWGFDWRPYSELFRYAKDQGLEVVGLDRSSPRDSKIASYLEKLSNQKSDKLFWVLLGEHHLAPTHAPHPIEKLFSSTEVLYIHQNSESFDLQRLKNKKVSEYDQTFKLNSRHYYKASGTPWSRYASALRWLDGDLSETLPEGDAERTQWYELLYRVSHDFASLLQTEPLDLDGISVCTALQPPPYEKTSLLKFSMENGLCLILESQRNKSEIFVPYFSENYGYEILGRLYYRRRKPLFSHTYGDFFQEHLAGHFVANLWNPTRRPLSSLSLSHKNSKEHNSLLQLSLEWRDLVLKSKTPLNFALYEEWITKSIQDLLPRKKKSSKSYVKKSKPSAHPQLFIATYLSSYLASEALAKRVLDRIQENHLKPIEILESLFLGIKPIPQSWFKPRANETFL